MGKKIFVLIVVLMSISLIGIVSVQLYWINNAIESKENQFKGDVTKALARVSERLEIKEEDLFYNKIESFIKTKRFLNKAQIKNFLIQQIDTSSKSRFSFGTTIIEEDFKIPALDILDKNGFYDNDSIVVKRFTKKRDVFKGTFVVGDNEFKDVFNINKISTIDRVEEVDRKLLSDVFKDYKKTFPIEERINNRELNATLKEELERNNINIDYKYGVYNNDLATKLKSGYYTINPVISQSYPLFINNEGISNFTLYIDFPDKNKHILSDISNILLLSLFFIFIIVVAFSSSLYQLVKQKKISEIKTDFINNMTHEFKTPIATINLALDALKNPKVIDNKEFISRYHKMIREENRRMHTQVENVLRISKLEKDELDLEKSEINMQEIITDAVTHVCLIVENKGGYIKTHFFAENSNIFG
ncbi:MAG: two-component sensor histidine kinase, partial [Flavobacterium sp.]|nr:two-component sensor histidine kinase [Flavobacterium sp.]